MEDNRLFSEFPPVPTEKWEEVIVRDLKGADYEKKLVWKTPEGFRVKPYYRAEDLEEINYLESNPGQAPYTRGKQTDGNVWDIRQDVRAESLEQANALALEALERGANSIGLCTCKVNTLEEMQVLLRDINPEACKVNFTCGRNMAQVLRLFVQVIKANGYDPAKVYGSANCDIYGHALLHGAYRDGEEEAYRMAAELVAYAKEELPNFRVLGIGGKLLRNAGSTIVQELGFSLAAASDLMAHLTDLGIEAHDVARNLVFNFATGSNYFMEIAKIRAARLLWSTIAQQYAPDDEESRQVFINATGAEWNKTIFDPYVNMLRTTTETMSAAIAGADSITTPPFNVAYKRPDSFGYRIGRNQQLLLKEESYMDKIVDPAAGSYYIENLTDSIAQYAWQLFLTVEKMGGFATAIRQNFVQDEVEKSANQRNTEIATRRITLLGTNQYPNLQERMADKIAAESACPRCACGKEEATDFKPLHPYRGAEAFEQLRLATERSGRRPRVFLLTYGNLTMRKARSGFATNFFGVAGYEIIDNPGFASAEEGAKAALEAKADIVVLCSSDDEYAEITQTACQLLKGKVRSIVLAGYPKDMVDTYREQGVDEFIHVKTNVLDCLTQFQQLFLN